MPFDQFVRELISPSKESEGFIYGITWRGNVNASQKREVQFAQNVSQVFLGMNMKCASCHDSFIDRWTLAETYGLAAIYSEQPLELYRCDKPTGKVATTRFLWPELGDIDANQPRAERLERHDDIAGEVGDLQEVREDRPPALTPPIREGRRWQPLKGQHQFLYCPSPYPMDKILLWSKPVLMLGIFPPLQFLELELSAKNMLTK
jgi:hypothetical protein